MRALLLSLSTVAFIGCAHSPESLEVNTSTSCASYATSYSMGACPVFDTAALPGMQLYGLQTSVQMGAAATGSPGPISPVAVPRD